MSVRAAGFWLLGLCIAFDLRNEASASARPEPIVTYVVRKGDNLYNLAERYFRRVSDYQEVQRLNRIADPFRIPIGRKIKIPFRILRQLRIAGNIVSARGQTFVADAKGRRRLTIGDRVSEGDRVITGPNSFVTMRLDNDTVVNFPSQSTTAIRILRKTALTGRVERLLWLEEGRMKASVPKLQDGEDFRIQTPVSVSAVRGTEYRVTFDKAEQRSGTEVLAGVVGVLGSTQAPPQPVAAGYGLVVRPQQTDGAKSLLPAPAIASIANSPSAGISLTLGPVNGAVSYHAQIAMDEMFVDTVAEAWSKSQEVTLAPEVDGAQFVRVSAIDRDGLEGFWATQQLPAPNDQFRYGLKRSGHFGSLDGSAANLRIQIRRDQPDGQVVIDAVGTSKAEAGVAGLAAGTYYWRMMDNIDPMNGWSAPRKLVITRQE